MIIQLLGLARSGKDWTATQLKTYFESQGKSVEIYSYAAPMKRLAATLFDISLEQLDDFKNRSNNVVIEVYDNADLNGTGTFQFETNFRTFLQRLGNEAMKSEFGDSVWADLMLKQINQSTADIIIIPDCRFTVELETIGGITVRVVNNSLPPPMQHASELELADIPTKYTLDNTNYQATPAQIAELAQRIINES